VIETVSNITARTVMDRNIVYPGAIPLDTDLLSCSRNTMIGFGGLLSAVLGGTSVVDGLVVAPTIPASLGITVGPGSVTQLAPVDQNAYGSLPADVAHTIVKMGINIAPTSFMLTAPTASGEVINYIVQAAFSEADVDPVVLPYYNAASPAQPYLGPGNDGVAQATLRQQSAQLQVKAGAAALAGTQATPPVDAGWVGLAVISVGYGEAQITAAAIAPLPGATSLPFKLPALRPGFSTIQSFAASGNFVVPNGVSRVRVTVIGGGGSGGTHASLPGGGGGAGGQAIRIISGLAAGSVIPVTVGAAGAAPGGPGNGGSGGTSSFGVYVSATGGLGGIGGSALATCAGNGGGAGYGGDVNLSGAWGTDAIPLAARGGDGGGPGNGRGTSAQVQGVSAGGVGGGGGGGGCSIPGGGGAGAAGGNGGPGLVVVEY
jgi:hypothetical protein